MKKFSFSEVAGLKLLILLKMDFFIGLFQGFDCKLQNTYFPEHFSLAAAVAYFVLVLLT